MRMLIVDDSNIIRSKITRTLTQHHMEVVATASNGEDAIALFSESRPDVVTMDLTMPRMDGLECIRALRRINANAHILVVSALADKSTAIQALKDGALVPIHDEAAIAIPNFLKSREESQKNACIANLKQLEGAIEHYQRTGKTDKIRDTMARAFGELF